MEDNNNFEKELKKELAQYSYCDADAEDSYKFITVKAKTVYKELIELYNYLQSSDYCRAIGLEKFSDITSETDIIIEHVACLQNISYCTYETIGLIKAK